MARLSVIVTSYNIEDYLEGCLESIVGQTLADLEIIVVDDGSSDRSPEIIRAFAGRDPRIVPVLLPNNSIGGVATAANAGLDHATAEYVGFADGDDLYEPKMFELLLEAAESADTDLAMCRYLLLDDTDDSTAEPPEMHRWEALVGRVHRLDVPTTKQFLQFIAVPWRKIYRRSMLETNDIRFPVGDYFYEDNPFHWFTVVTADSIAVVPEILCYHRVARVGQTMATVDARLLKIFEHHDTILAWLEGQGVDEAYRPTLLGWAMSQMSWISRRTPQELRRSLWDILREVYAHYDDEAIDQALAEGVKGQVARSLSRAIVADNFAAFSRILDTGGAHSGPLESARYHLRYSGVGETARMTGRYGYQKLATTARRAIRAGARLARTAPGRASQDRLSNEDLMFGLMVIEDRLRAIEQRLDDLTSEHPDG